MGFRYTNLGGQISTDPAKAAEELKQLLVKYGNNQSQLAKAEGIDYRTLTRWLERLEKAGHDVRTQALDELTRLKEKAEAEGTPLPPEPPKAGRKKR